MTESPPDDRYSRARRTGKRAAHALILVVAVLFIGSSTWQLVQAVFLGNGGAQARPLDPICADGLRRLSSALDRAAALVVAAPSPPAGPPADDAVALFRRDLSPEWDGARAVEETCAASVNGEDAWATLTRLRSAHEQLARRGHAELAPFRHDLAAHLAHLPVDLR
jgi:hypothetical protein